MSKKHNPFFDDEQLHADPDGIAPGQGSEILRALSHPCPLDVVVGLLVEGVAEYSGPIPKTLRELKELFSEMVTEQLGDDKFKKACRESAREEMTDFGNEIVRRLFIVIRDHQNAALTCDTIAKAAGLDHVKGRSYRELGRDHGVSGVTFFKRVQSIEKQLGLNVETDEPTSDPESEIP